MINKYPYKINIEKKNKILDNFDYYFSHGRTSLKYGIEIYNLSKSTILVPEYICFEVVDTLKYLGMNIKYYELTDSLLPIYRNLETLIDSSVRSILFVNYFGLPINIEYHLNFCKEKKIIMIEDNAHGFSGTFNGKLLGNYGDIGITSPRKNLNVMSGGFLYIKDKSLLKKINLTKIKLTLKWKLFKILPNLVNNFLNYTVKSIKIKFLQKKNINVEYYKANLLDNFFNYQIDDLSKYIIEHQNYEKLNLTRREIFSIWREFINYNKFKIIETDYRDGLSPMCIAFLVKDIIQRNNIIDILNKNYVEAYTWPLLPKEIYQKQSNGYLLFSRIVCLPISFDTNLDYLKYLINKLKKKINK